MARRLAWYVVPALAVLAALGYIGLSVAWHSNPPFTAVQGTSMEPFLQTGDLVLLHGVNPASLKKGDVIAVEVPKSARSRYGLPAQVVHRIIAIYHRGGGLVFQTKGDNNPGPDVFQTPAADVVGEMTGKVNGLGYPILFFQSRQGIIFLGAAGGLILIYLFLGFLDKRKEEDPRVVLMASVLDETRQLRADIAGLEDQPSAALLPAVPTAVETPADELLRRLAEAVAVGAEVTAGTARSNEELVAAVSEYGVHLKSHTEAVQSMAAAAVDLKAVTAALQEMLTGKALSPPGLLAAPEPPAVVHRAEPVGVPGPAAAPFGGEELPKARGGRTVATREVQLEWRRGEAAGQGEIVDMVGEAVTELLADAAALHDIEVTVEFVTIGGDEASSSSPWSCVLANGPRPPGGTIAVRVEDWSDFGLSLAAYIFDGDAPAVVISLGAVRGGVVADREDRADGPPIESVVLIASVESPADELLGSSSHLLDAIARQLPELRP